MQVREYTRHMLQHSQTPVFYMACSMLQCVATCCSELQCVAVCCRSLSFTQISSFDCVVLYRVAKIDSKPQAAGLFPQKSH